MGTARGCTFPDDLWYNVEDNIWGRQESDGTVTIGMTGYAVSLAGQIVAYTPKKAGKEVKQGKSAATVESGKWVGPAKSLVSGEIAATNPALAANPGLINSDPYGQGWLVRIKPSDWAGESAVLLQGQAALDAFEKKMEADGYGGC